jgi:CubicO group peptidase (beta-lactamase class C family)
MLQREVGMGKWVTAAAACVAIVCTSAGRSKGDSLKAGMNGKIDAVFAPLVDETSPGFAVLVRDGGKTVFERGYGVRDLRTMAKIDERTDFRLASVTKQFTAMAIMLLAHDGNLRYDETLGRVFPEFPAWGKAITIRNLLNHTSGLPDYETLMDEVEKNEPGQWSAEQQIQDEEVLQLIEQRGKPKFEAGTRWEYSNSGYVLLGLVVARVSGKPFGEFARERIFAPLQMKNTLVYVKGKNNVPNRAFGHARVDGEWKETDQSSTSATQGDGGIYSNVEDLARWDEALAKHTLLSEKEMQPALTPVKMALGRETMLPDDAPQGLAGKPVEYGFGWFLDPYKGHSRMWHYGDTMGFKTAIHRFTRDGLTVIVLANRTDQDPGELAVKVVDLLLDRRNQGILGL